MKESELYLPIKAFFENMGYTVKGEVKGCDLVAEKDGRFVAVELKTSFNLKLVYQALERRKIAKEVYVCIPRPKNGARSRAWKDMVGLLKEIQVGLITVAVESPVKTVEIVIESGEKKGTGKKALSLKAEFESRSQDLNIGGVRRTKLMTAYREKSVKMAALCLVVGDVKTKTARELGCDNSEIRLLSDNFYGWFEKLGRGVYAISEKGREEIKEEKYNVLFEYYTKFFLEAYNK